MCRVATDRLLARSIVLKVFALYPVWGRRRPAAEGKARGGVGDFGRVGLVPSDRDFYRC